MVVVEFVLHTCNCACSQKSLTTAIKEKYIFFITLELIDFMLIVFLNLLYMFGYLKTDDKKLKTRSQTDDSCTNKTRPACEHSAYDRSELCKY